MDEAKLVEIIKREIQKYYKSEDESSTINILGDNLILREELGKKFKISKDSKKVVVVELDTRDFVNLGMGSYFSEIGENILNSLLSGKEVFLIEEGITWRKFEKIPFELEKKYLEYEENLKKYGIKIVKKIEIVDEILRTKKRFRGNVLDVKHLIQNLDTSEKKIEVSPETIITELAKEYAQINDIEIIKR